MELTSVQMPEVSHGNGHLCGCEPGCQGHRFEQGDKTRNVLISTFGNG